MGYLLSKLWWSSDPAGYDEPNAQTGLTPREVNIVRSTWGVVRKDLKGNGVDLFLKFFELHPEYQKMFRAFADVPRDRLRTNGRLLGHATSVMYAVTSIVDNVDDPECLFQLLHKIAESHVPRKVEDHHFQNLALTIVIVLEMKLGPKLMDEAAKSAWKKTLDTANSVIFSEMEKTKQR